MPPPKSGDAPHVRVEGLRGGNARLPRCCSSDVILQKTAPAWERGGTTLRSLETKRNISNNYIRFYIAVQLAHPPWAVHSSTFAALWG